MRETEVIVADQEKATVCVLDASTYVGFWVLKKLLIRGYRVHAAVQKNGEKDIMKKIMAFEKTEERLDTFTVDVLDYHSILEALKGCCALFCCLDNADGYDDKNVDLEVRGSINVVEACAQTATIDKVIFSSSLTAAIWRENLCSQKDVDERSWSDPEFCKKKKSSFFVAYATLYEFLINSSYKMEKGDFCDYLGKISDAVSFQSILHVPDSLEKKRKHNLTIQNETDEVTLLKGDEQISVPVQLWYALAKTLTEKAAWALAMDRMLNMVSINAGLVIGPSVAQQNPILTMAYLQGAAQMFESGVLAFVDVKFLADVYIRAFENHSTSGRYFCFNQIVNTGEEAVKFAESLSPLISLHPRYEYQENEAYAERLQNKKLNKLVEGTTAC